MAKSVDKIKTDIVSENQNSNISEVFRAFKRLRVDESVVTHSNHNSDNYSDNSDNSSLKSSAHSPRKWYLFIKKILSNYLI
jgi:hypothetical protein